MLKTYLIGLIIFSAIKIGIVIIAKYRKHNFKIKLFEILFECVIWPIPCCWIIYLAIKEIRQQRFIKKIRASRGKR